MDAVVFLLVLGAARLHATWTMLVKSVGDQLAVMGMIAP
jgi:hypothetical protein